MYFVLTLIFHFVQRFETIQCDKNAIIVDIRQEVKYFFMAVKVHLRRLKGKYRDGIGPS